MAFEAPQSRPGTPLPRPWEAARGPDQGRGNPDHPSGEPRPAEGTRDEPTDPQPKGGPARAYQHRIRRDLDRLGLLDMDPRHVEASMRCAFGTLDHLGGAAWDRAVAEAVTEVQAMGPEISETLAESWGLWQPARRTDR